MCQTIKLPRRYSQVMLFLWLLGSNSPLTQASLSTKLFKCVGLLKFSNNTTYRRPTIIMYFGILKFIWDRLVNDSTVSTKYQIIQWAAYIPYCVCALK